MPNLSLFISIVPLLFFIFLLFVRKTTLLKASILTLVFYTLLAVFYWQIIPNFLLISYSKGFVVAIDILIIIFGAIFFLEVLKHFNILKNISYYLSGISKDYRIQVIIIAWFFECFLEGTAGFGVPSAVAMPLLVGLGLPPVRALIVGLLGNSSPGIFGAAGTPIKVGFATLNTPSVPFYASLINFVGILIPIFIVWASTHGRSNRKKEFFEALPFAIWSGFLFFIPSFLAARYLGQEFPTIIGSVVGMSLAIISIKFKIFTPKNVLTLSEKKEDVCTMSPFKSFLPYGLMVIFLILGKIIFGKVGFPLYLGFNYTFNLFNPGFIFIIVGIIIYIIWERKRSSIVSFIKIAVKEAFAPFLIISSMLAMVQIMTNSGNNISGIPSAISIIAGVMETNLLPFFAPFAGAFGSFMTGSVTASNIMFGSLFNMASLSMNFNSQIILALLVVGGGIGNMIALADILTAEAVIGEKNAERKIIKGVIVPCLVCLLSVGIVGLIVLGVL